MFARFPSSQRMRRLSHPALLILFFLCFALSSAGAQELSVPGALAPEDKSWAPDLSVEDLAASGKAPLSRLYDYIKLDELKVRRLPQLDERDLPVDDGTKKREQIGVTRTLTLDALSTTSFYRVPGGSVGVIGIVTEGALMTRVHFSDVALPPGATIFVYSMRNREEFYGPLEGGMLGDRTFWTPPVTGEGIIIEYFIPDGPGWTPDQSARYFNISEVSHIYRSPADAFKPGETTDEAAGACNLNVTTEWANVAKSVGHLQFTSGGGDFICTGTLLNTTSSSFVPYLLTANHCFDTQAEAQSLRVYWNYNSPGLPGPPNRTDGATLLATGTTSDFTFVRLTGAIPSGLYFSGWDASAPPAVGTNITGIHHPDGDYKRISFGSTQTPSCGGVVSGLQCITVRWSGGTTEGGSSGSGLWKGSASDPRLIGTLTGGAASCSNPSGIDQYGRFDVTYPNISQYLSTGTPTPTPTPTPLTQANLTPFQPSGWSDKIVLSKVTGTNTDGTGFLTTDTIYVDWAVINNGDAAANATFFSKLYIDGVERQTWNTTPPLDRNFYTSVQDYSIGTLSAGQHTIRIVTDTSGAIAEKNEADNEYSRVITVTAPTPSTLALSSATYSINEGDAAGFLTVTVNRTGGSTSAISVDFLTSDASGLLPCQTNGNGMASDRCDYARIVGTLRFASGEMTKSIQIPLINDAYMEPAETFSILLRNAQGASLGTSLANVTITDNDVQPATQNPIDNQAFFIRQQYIDFLGRVAEDSGFSFWNSRMTNCPAGQICDRIDTSMRFFQSDEFQARGFYIYRLYDAVLGRLPLYAEFVPDVARLNGPQTVEEQRLGKDAYLLDLINKTEFRNIYGQYLSANGLIATNPTGFVDALCARAGITPASRQTLINNLAAGTRTPAQTIEDFILTPELSNVGTLFYDRGFITMQYFGYLRRDPETAGFNFWVGQLIGANAPHRGDYRFMVGGFLQADEYRFRYALISAP
jgi:lysyl endopeptidase